MSEFVAASLFRSVDAERELGIIDSFDTLLVEVVNVVLTVLNFAFICHRIVVYWLKTCVGDEVDEEPQRQSCFEQSDEKTNQFFHIS